MMRFLLAITICCTSTLASAQSPIYRCGEEYTNTVPEDQKANCMLVEGGAVVAQGTGSPSILSLCIDPGPLLGVGPSARARECTRQYCARAEYQSKVSAYAMNQQQSKSDQIQAITCITRREQDRQK